MEILSIYTSGKNLFYGKLTAKIKIKKSLKGSLYKIALSLFFAYIICLVNPKKHIWLVLFRPITFKRCQVWSIFPFAAPFPQDERDTKEKHYGHRRFQPIHPKFLCTSPYSSFFLYPLNLKLWKKRVTFLCDFIWKQAWSQGWASACCLGTESLLIEVIKKTKKRKKLKRSNLAGKGEILSERVKRHWSARPVYERRPRKIGKGRAEK